MPPMVRVRSELGVLALGLLAILAAHVPSYGQTVYRWVDERGVVHFSQEPPPPGQQFEVQHLPQAPEAPEPTEEASSPEPEGAEAELTPALPTGAARIEISGQSVGQIGPSMRRFTGELKNTGGRPAEDVRVEIVVTEVTQGDECLRAEVEAQPSDLAPNATATYQTELDSPCFFGETRVEIEPLWTEGE